MKKIILSAVAVFAFGFANAQEVKFGIKGGLNIANISGDSVDNKAIIGINAGGFVNIEVSDKFSIQPELLFSTQGVKTKFTETGYPFTSIQETHLSYLNVPVMVKFYVVDKFSLEAGPQIGFLISAKADFSETDNGVSTSRDGIDIKDSTNSIDFGLNLGAGYDFTEYLTGGIRYNIGLSNVAKTDEGDNSKYYNSVFSLSVGYKF